MKVTAKNIFALFFAMALLGLTSACSTMEGVGKDVQKAGEWIEKKAE
ncbi:MAG: entericidin A/B family lipoprotein [Methylocystaceae bacterium]|nr:entericidin A/B family lipoprotein [Methylocystaceae bacterium]